MKYNSIYTLISVAWLLTACGASTNTASSSGGNTSGQGGTSNTVNDNITTVATRICSTSQAINGVTEAKLENFFGGYTVSNLKNTVSYCLSIYEKGNNTVTADFTVEYEDYFGISRYVLKAANNQFLSGTIKITPATGNPAGVLPNVRQMELIFVDTSGLISIAGSEDASGNMNATIKYYNFPTFDQALQQAVDTAAQNCKNGTYTVAQCLGYSYNNNTYWWNVPYYPVSQQALWTNMARLILNLGTGTVPTGSNGLPVTLTAPYDGSQTNTLGTMSFYYPNMIVR